MSDEVYFCKITDEVMLRVLKGEIVSLIDPVPGKSIEIVSYSRVGVKYKLVDPIKTEYAAGGKVEIKYEKDETITIKKALWDEMLAAKESLDWIKGDYKDFKLEAKEHIGSLIRICNLLTERIEKLESLINKEGL